MENKKSLHRDLLNGYDERIQIDDAFDLAEDIAEALSEILKCGVERINISIGQTFVCAEYVAPPEVPFKKIASVKSELEYRMGSARPLRLYASPLGNRTFCIEFPNPNRVVLGLKTLLSAEEFEKAKKPAFPVGAEANGRVAVCRLDRVPNLLVGGRTASGKSEFMHSALLGLMYGSTPDELRFILIDTKAVDFVMYAHSPYLLFDSVMIESERALEALNYALSETDRRYKVLAAARCRSIDDYNEKSDIGLPHIVIVVSELADLMHGSLSKEIEGALHKLMERTRATGIHIILFTELLSADVVRGMIKANTSGIVAFKTNTEICSRILLDREDGVSLIGCGDALYKTVLDTECVRVQTGFVTDEEIERVTDSARNKYDARFVKFGAPCIKLDGAFSDIKYSRDPLVPQVLAMMIETGDCSVVSIRRAFNVGFNRAVGIHDYCEEHEYIVKDGGDYKANITREKLRELFGEE